jgi:hypothetical protein
LGYTPEDRRFIDPEGKHGAGAWRLAEQVGLGVVQSFPMAKVERTRDVLQIDILGEHGVTLVISDEVIDVRLPTVRWIGQTPVESSLPWKRLKHSGDLLPRHTGTILAAMEARRAQFAQCRYCLRKVAAEHLHSPDVCHGCAERHLGVVH